MFMGGEKIRYLLQVKQFQQLLYIHLMRNSLPQTLYWPSGHRNNGVGSKLNLRGIDLSKILTIDMQKKKKNSEYSYV